MSNAAKRHMQHVAEAGCLIGNRGLDACAGRVQVHHVAEGSGRRSDWATVGLCEKHHDPLKSGTGFHGMGTERFCKLFRIPGENEYGLLVWQFEDLAKHRRAA